MSEVPRGWVRTHLANLGEPDQQTVLTGPFGANLGRADFLARGVPVFTIGCLATDAINRNKLLYVSPEKAQELSAYLLREGDFLFSRMASVGRVGFVPADLQGALFNYHLMRLRLDSEIVLPRFFYFFIRGAAQVETYLREVSRGATRDGINTKLLLNLPVSVPPLPEQRRIVAKIDNLTGKSRRARDHLDHIPRLVEKYKQAVLAAAFVEAHASSGHLTMIGEIASEVRNGLSKKPTEGPEGTPILRISAVRPRQVRLDDVRYYPREEVPTSAMLRGGDLLFTRYNGNPEFTAVCGQVRHIVGELTYPDKLIRVRLKKDADPSFVELMATSEQSRVWFGPHIKSAAGQHGISGADLKRLPIPLPSLATQQVMVRRIEAAFVWIDRLASDATSARKLIDRLDQAVLAKAFRGELVAQDPADEPASVLLERIRAERGASPKARRGRKGKAA